MSLFVTDEVKTFAHTVRPRSSPWGKVDNAHEIAPGMWQVGTSSHGGILISAERRAAMPERLRDVPTFAGGNAYEEDCDWSIVALAFPDCFTSEHLNHARMTLAGFDCDPMPHQKGVPYYIALRAAAQFIKQGA